MTIEDRQNALLSMREQHHSACPVCGDQTPDGLHAALEVRPDGSTDNQLPA